MAKSETIKAAIQDVAESFNPTVTISAGITGPSASVAVNLASPAKPIEGALLSANSTQAKIIENRQETQIAVNTLILNADVEYQNENIEGDEIKRSLEASATRGVELHNRALNREREKSASESNYFGGLLMNRLLQTVLLAGALLFVSCEIQERPASGDPTTASSSTDAPEKDIPNTDASLPSSPHELMKNVASVYSNARSFNFSGLSVRTSEIDGKEGKRSETEFQVQYIRGGSSFIRWREENKDKVFRTDGTKAWLEVDGMHSVSYSTPVEGISAVSLTPEGLSRFLFKVFVFRDELAMNDVFFAGLNDPRIHKETELNGRSCYLLSGTFDRVDATMTYWIDKERFVVHRIERVIRVRNAPEEMEYVATTKMSETYSDTEIR